MIIGTFRTIDDDGFIGHIVTLSFGQVPVVFVPLKKEGTFDLLVVGPDDEKSIGIGKAVHKQGLNGGYLEVQMDCPALPEPITAKMKLKPSRDGLYTLEWKRERLPD